MQIVNRIAPATSRRWVALGTSTGVTRVLVPDLAGRGNSAIKRVAVESRSSLSTSSGNPRSNVATF